MRRSRGVRTESGARYGLARGGQEHASDESDILVFTASLPPTPPDGSGGTAWYIVDSKAAAPEVVGGAAELALHLGMEAREHQGHVFIVSDGEADAGGSANGSAEDEKVAAG